MRATRTFCDGYEVIDMHARLHPVLFPVHRSVMAMIWANCCSRSYHMPGWCCSWYLSRGVLDAMRGVAVHEQRCPCCTVCRLMRLDDADVRATTAAMS